MKKVLALIGLSMALVGVGCGGSGPAGTCTTMSGGMVTTCVEYTSGFTTAQAMSNCSGTDMTYASSGTCTATNRVGRCTITATSGGATASSVINFYPPTTLDLAMQACTAAGSGGATATFTAN